MRLFIAIPLEKKTEDFLGNIIEELKRTSARVKWVGSEKIHLTLKFLGETDKGQVTLINKALEEISRKFNPMTGIIDKVGAFPNPRKPRVIWAGFSEQIVELADLAEDIDNAMSEFGFDRETRKFKSHLTLGRPKDPRNVADLPDILQNYNIEPHETIFDTIVLFKSDLTPNGPIYTRLFETKLKSDQIFS